jgi:hypothetical protein
VLAHAPVLLVDDERLLGVPGYRRLAVVWYEDRRGSAEEREHADVRAHPGLLVCLVEFLGVEVVGIREARREHVDLEDLAGVADPVDLYRRGRLVLDAHADVVALRPFAVLLAEGGVHVRLLAAGDGRVAVLVPQKRHRHPAPVQLRCDALVVDRRLVP